MDTDLRIAFLMAQSDNEKQFLLRPQVAPFNFYKNDIIKNMGMTKVKLVIKNPLQPSKKLEGEFLVDGGAHFTVVPSTMVKKLGLKPAFEQDFSLADGKTIKRNIGNAMIEFEKHQLILPVVLGQKDDDPLLGVTTLESFGLMLDPFKRRIYRSKLMLA